MKDKLIYETEKSAQKETHIINGSLTKGQSQHSETRIVFQQMVLEQLDIHMQNKIKLNLDTDFIFSLKINRSYLHLSVKL
jgi:hypothetical protein